MKIDLDIDLRGLDPDAWRARIDDIGEEHGYYQTVGREHAALFIDAGPKLLVTFEHAAAAMAGPKGQPRGFEMVTREGWSLLTILSSGDTWFRSDALVGYFDRLVDECFLEDFDDVLFFGIHDGGYAAAAYSVAAPGARALLLRPVATLDPAVTGWDRRFARHRRKDFTSRYGYGPDMIEALDRVDIIVDPTNAPDAIHAALYRRPNVTVHAARFARPRVEALLDAIGATPGLMTAAMTGGVSRQTFARAWRQRRDNPGYVRALLARLEKDQRSGLAAHVCAYGLDTGDAAYFEGRMAAMADLAAAD